MGQFVKFVPNILSTVRLAIASVFPFCPESWWVWLVVSGGLSDFLDGWIARRWQAQSSLGGILDAVADKIFILVALITVSLSGRFAVWWVPALIARDLAVAFTAGYAAYYRLWESFHRMKPRWSGKVATAGQFLFLVVALLFPRTTMVILSVTVCISVAAACDYGVLFIQALRQRAEGIDFTS